MTDGIAFHTPDYDGNALLICRRLALPSFLWPTFNGAFGALIEETNWYQFGDMPIDDVVQAFIDAYDNMVEGCMIGSVIAFANEFLPDNILVCDGASYAVADYPELAGVLFPPVTGSTFIVPDLRGRFVRGVDGLDRQGVPLASQGGEAHHTLTVEEMPSHSHGYITTIPSVTTVVVPDEPSAITSPANAMTTYTGGSLPHNNLPPFYALRYGIVAK